MFWLSQTQADFADLRYDQSQLLPSTSSPSVSDRLFPLREFFGQTPLKVVPSTCSPRHSGMEMVVVEEQQMIQTTGGKKVEGGWKMT